MRIEHISEKAESEDGKFVLTVYKSPKGTGEVLGDMVGPAFYDSESKSATIPTTSLGVPVKEAFARVQKIAVDWEADLIVISDPDNLFADWREFVSK